MTIRNVPYHIFEIIASYYKDRIALPPLPFSASSNSEKSRIAR